jgi:hypothetical protein
MSVNARNPWKTYSALNSDLVVQTGRLGDCGPICVRTALRFFGVSLPLTYKDFIKAGYHTDASGGTPYKKVTEFFNSEKFGLIVNTCKIKDKKEFFEKLKAARKSDHPVMLMAPGHLYTVLPHDFIKLPVEGKVLHFRLNKKIDEKKGVFLNITARGYKNLAVCFNSRFFKRFGGKHAIRLDRIDPYYKDLETELVEIEKIWEEFKECDMNFHEVKGVKLNLGNLSEPKYEFKSTKAEYKKRLAEKRIVAKYWFKKYTESFKFYCDCAFSYRIIEIENDKAYIIRENAEKATEHYLKAANRLERLEKDVFSVYGIGAELRKDFNKNLPALIGERRVDIYTKN